MYKPCLSSKFEHRARHIANTKLLYRARVAGATVWYSLDSMLTSMGYLLIHDSKAQTAFHSPNRIGDTFEFIIEWSIAVGSASILTISDNLTLEHSDIT